MRSITVYRREDGSNSCSPTRDPIGSVFELRMHERVNNYNDLSRLARRLFALDTTDDILLLIDVGQCRPAYLPELTRDCSTG